MISFALVLILIAAGFAAWLAGRRSPAAARIIALSAVAVDFALGLYLWIVNFSGAGALGNWFDEVNFYWMPAFGIHFHLAMDGLSLLLSMLVFTVGIVAVLVSWNEVQRDHGLFYLNLMWTLAGIVGVFLALDLFVFYFAWELMLVPMYFLIVLWGGERAFAAATKFFIFTHVSSLLMLISILALVFAHLTATGDLTFEYTALLLTPLNPHTATWIMLGFFAAFAVKLPVIPLHTWLPDAYSEAPLSGTIVLSALMSKTAAFGMLRYVMALFPGPARELAPAATVLAVIGILAGGMLAFVQDDLKRFVAYISLSHLAFILLGIFVWNPYALQGVVVQIICHGLSIAGLFLVTGALSGRLGTRDLERMGGLWDTLPRLGGIGLFFAMAALALPGIGTFVGEFLILLGSWHYDLARTVAASLGIVASTVYGVVLMQRAFFGPNRRGWRLPDLHAREAFVAGLLVCTLLWLGLYPQPVLNTFRPAMNELFSTWK